MQVRRRPIGDGLGAVLRGLLTYHFEPLKCEIGLTVLIGNFPKVSVAASNARLLSKCLSWTEYIPEH